MCSPLMIGGRFARREQHMKANQFRPQLEQVEAREVPAAFSAQLADGSHISGIFTTPSGDPTTLTGTFSLVDLTVTRSNTNGAVYTTQPGAQATYSNGALVSVTGVAQGTVNGTVDTINLNGNTVVDGSYSAPLALDGAPTQQTFTLPDGTVGAVSYTIPWSLVDTTQANQSLTPTAFNVNIAGQNFTYPSANFTTAPTLQFQYGDLQGATFTVNTPGTPYLSIGIANGIASVQTAPNQFINAPAPQTNASVTIDFAALKVPATGGPFDLTIRVTAGTGAPKNVEITIEAGASANSIRDQFQIALFDNGFTVYAVGGATGTQLQIQGTPAQGDNPAQQLSAIKTFWFDAVGNPPKLMGRTKSPGGTLPTYTAGN
jgi:hypothetical protein